MLNPNQINERQKLKIKLGLLQYDYIMKQKSNQYNQDFQKVYTDFYLSSQRIASQHAYFDGFSKFDSNTIVTEIEEYLFQNLTKIDKEGKVTNLGLHEFSFSTKMLHTIDDSKPIFDSLIEDYLKNEEGLDLWWSNRHYKIKKGYTVKQIIENDWKLLSDWYSDRLKEINLRKGNGYDWIDWFDKEFGNFMKANKISKVSDVKKIDFMIIAFMS